MPTFIMSAPPFEAEPIQHVMCDICGETVWEWVGLRIVQDLVHICHTCVGAFVQADRECHRQWQEWRENSDYAPREA